MTDGVRIILRRLGAIEHAVFADAPHAPVPLLANACERRRPPSLCIFRGFPCSEKEHLPRIIDALLDIVFDESRIFRVESEMPGNEIWVRRDAGARSRRQFCNT